MSILLLGAGDPAWPLDVAALVRRLVEHGDEIRALEDERLRLAMEELRTLGAHIALGDVTDADLVYRAGLGCRTIVALDASFAQGMEAAVAGAREAGIDRVVACFASRGKPELGVLKDWGGHTIALWIDVPRLGRRRFPPSEDLVEAIDAADDLVETSQLVLDLGDASSWERLGLGFPGP